MCERHSSIHSHAKDDGNEKLLTLITTQEQQQESVSINTMNEVFETIDSTDKKESETEPLLDEIISTLPVTSNIKCANVPARYVIAIYAVLGFFCLYSMRVNLSVAIVATVAPQSFLNQSTKSCLPLYKNSTEHPPIYGGCIFTAGILTLLAPLATRTCVGLFIANRILTGIVTGPGSPSAAIPLSERSTVPPISQAGSNFGTIITTTLMSMLSCLWFIGWRRFGYNSPDQHPPYIE
ncbi:unnamed protein product [Rotaria magnacalcarata]|uniref:Uncharacterized protein n=1 Tax=Rotaria magnacalcarata TaxID=392030 RepID=A0A820CAZ2_9BILA|nr:unnamed protein product [Rotaria magnacalcarata]